MSKLSRTVITLGIIGAIAVSTPLLAHSGHGDREARHGNHTHMMMARGHGEGHYRGRHHESRADMSHEERKAHREQMRVEHMGMRLHWNTLSHAEQENYRVQARMRMDERRAAWEAMSSEEREAKRQEMHERRGGMRGHSH